MTAPPIPKFLSPVLDTAATGTLCYMLTGSVALSTTLAILFVAKQEIYVRYLTLAKRKS